MLQILLIAGLVALAFALRRRDELNPAIPSESTQEEPESSGAESVVQEFFDAASRGDDAAYLRLTAGQLRRSLENDRAALGAEAFRAEIRRSTEGVKGLAVTLIRDSLGSDDTAAVDVEHVFVDRVERQRMLLARQGDTWAIVSIQAAQMTKPAIPYGTPVFVEPEADKTTK